MIEVCTVYAPRTFSVDFLTQYRKLLKWQCRSLEMFNDHRHTVVTDDPSLEVPFNSRAMLAELPRELMPAMIAGVIERLRRPVTTPIVFVDVDVLIGADLHDAFGGFDIGLTRRANEIAPINNGAMYVWDAARALPIFEHALSICGTHWGGDQEAIGAAVAPVPDTECVLDRRGARVAFLSMSKFNCIPKVRGFRHHNNPFAIHFKGKAAKEWMQEYATNFLLTR